jgi:hypothetical protein
MISLPRIHPFALGIAAFAIVCFQACETTEYLEGTPPPNQKLTVSNVVIDTVGDTATGRTVRVRFRSSWEIDSVDFSMGRFDLGLELSSGHSEWTSRPFTISLFSSSGNRWDTISCTSATCSYMGWAVVHLLKPIPGGRYLTVADDTVKLATVVGP